MSSQPKIILFDLGGVLADLGDPAESMELNISQSEFWSIWLNSTAVAQFETGKITTPEFIPQIANELGVAEPEEFESRFRNWRLTIFAGAEELLSEAADGRNLALLSNTNAVHWEQISESTNAFDRFTQLFLSFKNGYYKPDIRTFEYVVAELRCAPADILFLDDTEANVVSARRAGIDARQVSGIASVRSALSSSCA